MNLVALVSLDPWDFGPFPFAVALRQSQSIVSLVSQREKECSLQESGCIDDDFRLIGEGTRLLKVFHLKFPHSFFRMPFCSHNAMIQL